MNMEITIPIITIFINNHKFYAYLAIIPQLSLYLHNDSYFLRNKGL